MKRAIYFDFSSGASGDMFLGSLVDLGVELEQLSERLSRLAVTGYCITAEKTECHGLFGTRIHVRLEDEMTATSIDSSDVDHSGGGSRCTDVKHHSHHGHRTFRDISSLIEKADLSEEVKRRAISIFERIARAEGRVHAIDPEQVHFHEVGAVDSIVDIVGVCLALEMLNWPRVLGSFLTDGGGTLHCQHGSLPVPAPATLEILREAQVPLRQCDELVELLTPTGAAIAVEFVERFGPMPLFKVEKIGYGFGSRSLQHRPNLLRAVLGYVLDDTVSEDVERERLYLLSTNVDDLPAELFGPVMDRLFRAGALDVWFVPIQMKKNRPATMIEVLCRPSDLGGLLEALFTETTTFGVRVTELDRVSLGRRVERIETEYGPIRVKLGFFGGRIVQVHPELEDCLQAAQREGVPLRYIQHSVWRHCSELYGRYSKK